MKFTRILKCPEVARKRLSFSLVEVVLAIGVVSFALLALMGLIPVGIKASQQSTEESKALNLLGGIVADRRASPFSAASVGYDLPALTNTLVAPVTNWFNVKDDYQVTTSLPEARYRVDYRITPPPAGQPGPFFGWFKASWPAQASAPENSFEMVVTFPQP